MLCFQRGGDFQHLMDSIDSGGTNPAVIDVEVVYKCTSCPTVYYNESAFRNHYNEKHSKKSVCLECDVRIWPETAKGHLIKKHSKAKVETCNCCASTFASHQDLSSHQKSIKKNGWNMEVVPLIVSQFTKKANITKIKPQLYIRVEKELPPKLILPMDDNKIAPLQIAIPTEKHTPLGFSDLLIPTVTLHKPVPSKPTVINNHYNPLLAALLAHSNQAAGIPIFPPSMPLFPRTAPPIWNNSNIPIHANKNDNVIQPTLGRSAFSPVPSRLIPQGHPGMMFPFLSSFRPGVLVRIFLVFFSLFLTFQPSFPTPLPPFMLPQTPVMHHVLPSQMNCNNEDMDICLLCEKYLLFGETAERHLILYHKAVAPARCPCCSWTFRHGDYAINHNRMMLKKNGYNFTPLVINKYPPGHFVRNKKHFPQDFMKFLTELQDNAKTKVSETIASPLASSSGSEGNSDS
ncbi:hypothetical protein CRE_12225 [Caenorhabditis remanei]|uniref:C2H2-type domain-containing protein n=1 Tax=Caenorhabditis remanei TaxID=31234 RepID=E3N0C4_CAERE|nr:hypothetical protein CRE_12225 [Caenorhabditis remanei]